MGIRQRAVSGKYGVRKLIKIPSRYSARHEVVQISRIMHIPSQRLSTQAVVSAHGMFAYLGIAGIKLCGGIYS